MEINKLASKFSKKVVDGHQRKMLADRLILPKMTEANKFSDF
ncbi:hypothetical protein WJ437_06580 [Ignavigranum ruoffiae]